MMERLLAFKFWMKMLSTFFDSIFPVTLAFLALGLFNKGGFKRGRALSLLATALCFGLFLRLLLFMFGLPSERRYLFSLVALAAVFAAPGIESLAGMILKLRPSLKAEWVALAVFATMFGICAGKGLNPSFDKLWMKDVALFVKEQSTGATKTYLIMDGEDMRIPYYAGARYVRFCFRDDENLVRKFEDQASFLSRVDGMLVERGRKGYSNQWVSVEGIEWDGIRAFAKNVGFLQRDGSKVFVLMEKDETFLREMFKRYGVPFPLKKLRSFKDEKRRPLDLYVLDESVGEKAGGGQ